MRYVENKNVLERNWSCLYQWPGRVSCPWESSSHFRSNTLHWTLVGRCGPRVVQALCSGLQASSHSQHGSWIPVSFMPPRIGYLVFLDADTCGLLSLVNLIFRDSDLPHGTYGGRAFAYTSVRQCQVLHFQSSLKEPPTRRMCTC